MKYEDIPMKSDSKQAKMVLKKLERFQTQIKPKNENVKRLRIVQSVKSGHIRGGHAFH
jgi:hypothetical protein